MKLPFISRPRVVPRQGLVLWASQRLKTLVATDEDGQDTTLGLLSALGRVASKGDIIIHTGVRWVRLALGSDGEVLTAASGEASGVKWASSGGGGGGGTTFRSDSTDRRVIRWVALVQSNQVKGIGSNNMAGDGGSTIKVWDDDGSFLARTPNGAGTGAQGRWHSNGNDTNRVTQLRTSPQVSIRVKTGPSLTRALFWAGIANGKCTNGAEPTRQRLMFRYLQGTDTKWMASVYDGTTQTHTAMTTTVAADTVYTLDIDYDRASGAATFTVNGTDTVVISSNTPSETLLMGPDIIAYNHTSGPAPWPQLALASFYIASL